MKSILIVCLCMWGLLVYGEKNNTVHLYGSLKEFKAAEVNMAPNSRRQLHPEPYSLLPL